MTNLTGQSTEILVHLGTNRLSVIREIQYFGSRGSWVQIPPRRPYLNYRKYSGILRYYSCSILKSICLILLFLTYERFGDLGTNSGQKNYSADAGLFEIFPRRIGISLSLYSGTFHKNLKANFLTTRSDTTSGGGPLITDEGMGYGKTIRLSRCCG